MSNVVQDSLRQSPHLEHRSGCVPVCDQDTGIVTRGLTSPYYIGGFVSSISRSRNLTGVSSARAGPTKPVEPVCRAERSRVLGHDPLRINNVGNTVALIRRFRIPGNRSPEFHRQAVFEFEPARKSGLKYHRFNSRVAVILRSSREIGGFDPTISSDPSVREPFAIIDRTASDFLICKPSPIARVPLAESDSLLIIEFHRAIL
jgi:hypothetical protein